MKNLAIHITRKIWVPILWTAIILTLLCLPGTNLESVPKWWKFPGYDKVIHFGLFASFVGVWLFHLHHLKNEKPGTWINKIILLVVIGIAIGIATEYIQKYLIPFRSFDVYDIYADITGCLFAGIYFLIENQIDKSNK